MISLLQAIATAILCLLAVIANILLGCLVEFMNILILSVAGWIQLIAAVLPEMPDEPNVPSSGVIVWLNWLFPVASFVALIGVALTMWIAVLGVRVSLRFLRALD